MINRVELAEKLFKEGYNCSQSVFAAFSDLYGIDREMALKLSSSFGGGIGRMREVCGAVSGMCMVAGLETGSSARMDPEGKKYNYGVVQRLSTEFKEISGSIICRELLNLESSDTSDTAPQIRNQEYYNKRPCVQLVKDAAEIVENVLYAVSIIPVITEKEIEEVSALARNIWHEHYDAMIGRDQVDYMLEKFQSPGAMKEQMENGGYQYYKLVNMGGLAGYFSLHAEEDGLFLSKLYIAKKNRGRDYARKVFNFLEELCSQNNLKMIWLTVNRNNADSIAVYEKLGFVKARTQVADIGSGYVMDDYIMEKRM
jgi:C_GCAxxG_C_C family probable redox protein